VRAGRHASALCVLEGERVAQIARFTRLR
jgi:hypothetical protein